MTLSDTFCVNRHLNDFKKIIEGHVDILFTNENEILALTGEKDVHQAIGAMRGMCEILAVTRSEQGSIIATQDRTSTITAIPPEQLVDSTGAGDAYAGGFLFGLTHGKTLEECGTIGSIAASEVISHMGPRPQKILAELI